MGPKFIVFATLTLGATIQTNWFIEDLCRKVYWSKIFRETFYVQQKNELPYPSVRKLWKGNGNGIRILYPAISGIQLLKSWSTVRSSVSTLHDSCKKRLSLVN